MDYYDMVKTFVRNWADNPDELVNIGLMSPRTPMEERRLDMDEVFNETIFKNFIVSNIHLQHKFNQIDLKLSTWWKVLEFLDQDFQIGSITLKIYLQGLLHFSKVAVNENVLNKSKYFDELISAFVNLALEPLETYSVITEMSAKDASLLKDKLISKPIIQAILANISSLETTITKPNINADFVRNKIRCARIYQVLLFKPYEILRGACLRDGILLCVKNVAGFSNNTKYRADLLTLAAHEFSHYIVRILVNDMNFPSPWTYRITREPRFDFARAQPLEIGRNTELILFDGVQPNWFLSRNEAAYVFLERIDSNVSSLPIITKKEQAELGLLQRLPSSFFGIDIMPENLLMC
ncbi:hypothetical protein Zmor_024115 [Zophobas morio]|uniref:Uncharacterized protein n=1 Tax=Zophobas morio TaxID=2755281 RepID=A0AA38HZW8_9CUCU|nr:hypothetical protein Zmor_024115 [Zophobas morio]